METLETQKAKKGDTAYCIKEGHANGRPQDPYYVGQRVVITHWFHESNSIFGAAISSNTLNKCDWSLTPLDRIINNYQIF